MLRTEEKTPCWCWPSVHHRAHQSLTIKARAEHETKSILLFTLPQYSNNNNKKTKINTNTCIQNKWNLIISLLCKHTTKKHLHTKRIKHKLLCICQYHKKHVLVHAKQIKYYLSVLPISPMSQKAHTYIQIHTKQLKSDPRDMPTSQKAHTDTHETDQMWSQF